MIDQNARNRIQGLQTTKVISDGIEKVVTALREASVAKPQVKTPANDLADELRNLQRAIGGGNLTESLIKVSTALDSFDVNENAIGQMKTLVGDLSAKLKLLADLEVKLPKEIKMNFPKEFPVTGKVDIGKIDSLPPLRITNLEEVSKSLATIINNLQMVTLKAIQASRTDFPKSMNVGNEVRIADFADLLDGIEELKKGFNLLLRQDKNGNPAPQDVNIMNFPPQMVPQPVTNVSLNPNRGTVKSTAVTVTTALTPLPGTALADRRAMTIYNNGSVTIFVGGSDVTSLNGIPVPASTYGPSLDAGPRNIVYAVTASSTSDVRVLEMNDLVAGGDN